MKQIALILLYSLFNIMANAQIMPPVCSKIKKEFIEHGNTRTDNYYWLNERENPKVKEYLVAENKYTEDVFLTKTADKRKLLFDEIKARIKEDDQTLPYFENGYWYYTKTEKGKEYFVSCRKKATMAGTEEILHDANIASKNHAYYAVGAISVSPNNKLMVLGVDTVSRRNYTLQILNVETGKFYNEAIDNTNSDPTWANDNKTFFYTKRNQTTLRSESVWKHVLGTPQTDDVKVYEDADETFSVGLGKSSDKQFIIVGSGATLSAEYYYIDANKPNDKPTLFAKREPKLEYSIDSDKGVWYVYTNSDNAFNFKIMKATAGKTNKENWTEFIAHRNDVLVSGFSIVKDNILISERTNATTQCAMYNLVSKKLVYIPSKEKASILGWAGNPEYNTKTLRYFYSSLTTPGSTYEYNIETKKSTLLKQQPVLGSFKITDYVSERLEATAQDGTKIPISLVYKKGTKLSAETPLLLYGYGSYGNSTDPSFSGARLSLLDRGFVFAIAHIRGGQENGRPWYENGKMFKKKNTFTDFTDCADFLIAKKYTSPKHLYAQGGSAGGLLMGAIINMRPELWNGILAGVPFVDVITTMWDETIPLTTSEFDEWGNPKNKDSYDYMLSYSPVDNVAKKAYPNMLVTTGFHDSQVQYFEPAKWVAKLRDYKTDNNLLIMDCNMETGHGGSSGRFKRIEETAKSYAFLLMLEGQ
jgi:oligopeptidase B